jgi:hypothetical protein
MTHVKYLKNSKYKSQCIYTFEKLNIYIFLIFGGMLENLTTISTESDLS